MRVSTMDKKGGEKKKEEGTRKKVARTRRGCRKRAGDRYQILQDNRQLSLRKDRTSAAVGR